MWYAEQYEIRASSTGFHTSYSWFRKPRMLLALFTARAQADTQLALHQDAQALSRDLSPGFQCLTCLIARALPSQVQVSAFVLVEFQSPFRKSVLNFAVLCRPDENVFC